MVRRISICLLALLLAPISLAAELIASVDRKDIGKTDAITLQIRYTGVAGFSAPEWNDLEQNWEILSTNQQQQIQFTNGRRDSYTDWTLTLLPKSAGELLIPAINFKGEYSDPIKIQVSAEPSSQASSTDNFYFEVEVSSGVHYVQEQILYIERLYYTVNHEEANLTELKVTDARLQPLMEPKQYITVIDGKRVGVYERRFAIFPEASGELVIPGQRFTARPTNRYDRYRSSTETVISKPIQLDIQPIPDDYPQAPWIPAQKFEISERFSKDFNEWKVGEPVTRTFTIRAKGLSSGQIPAIPLAEIPQLKYYPDQNKDNSDIGEQGITSTVTQSVALVPTGAGELLLPEIQIPWWNTLKNRVEYATLPERKIEIAEAANPDPIAPLAVEQTTNDQPVQQPNVAVAESQTNPYWMWATIGLLISNALMLLYILLRKPQKAEPQATQPQDEQDANAKAWWQAFKEACLRNDAKAIQSNLIHWATASSGQPLNSLQSVIDYYAEQRLKNALSELDAMLYSNEKNSAFNGQLIFQIMEELKQDKTRARKTQSQKTELAGLYPNN